MLTVAATPSSLPANATAAAWLPAEKLTTRSGQIAVLAPGQQRVARASGLEAAGALQVLRLEQHATAQFAGKPFGVK